MTTEKGQGAVTAGATSRPAEIEPFLRGSAWPAGAGVAYPRANPT